MIHDRDVGIFIATGNYTKAAQEFARSKANLRLINGAEFVELIRKFYGHARSEIPAAHSVAPCAGARSCRAGVKPLRSTFTARGVF